MKFGFLIANKQKKLKMFYAYQNNNATKIHCAFELVNIFTFLSVSFSQIDGFVYYRL